MLVDATYIGRLLDTGSGGRDLGDLLGKENTEAYGLERKFPPNLTTNDPSSTGIVENKHKQKA